MTPAETELQGKEEEAAALRWLGGHFEILVRLVLAFILTVWGALPLVDRFIAKAAGGVSSNFVAGFPLSVIKTASNPGRTEKSPTSQKSVQGDQPAAEREEEVREATSAVPRVFAYGIQIAGLLIALAGTLWAIAVLSRSD